MVSGALQAYQANPFSAVPGLLAAAGTGHAAGKLAKYGYGRAKRYLRGGTVVPYRPRSYSRKRSYRSSRKSSRRKFKRRRRKKSMRSKCYSLAKKVNQDTGELTYRARSTSQITCAVNVQAVSQNYHNVFTNIENGPCTKLYYYDPSNPGVLLNPDYTTGTYSRELNVLSSGIKLHVKNNIKGSVHMKAYLCTPRSDTSVDPKTDWKNRNADNPTTVSETVIGTSPMDLCPNLWNHKLMKTKLFQPGQSCVLKHFTKGFNYKPA